MGIGATVPASVSFIAALPYVVRSTVLEHITEFLNNHSATAGKAELELPYLTDVYWCMKRLT